MSVRDTASEERLEMYDRHARGSTELAREVLEWLRANDEGIFNICCQRCNAPFEYEGQPVAAPPEWYGGLAWEKELAEAVIAQATLIDDAEQKLRDALDTASSYDLAPFERKQNLEAITALDALVEVSGRPA